MQHVDVKVTGAVGTILMRRPEVRGALNPVMIADLMTAWGDLHRERRVRAVILAGGGPHFCSGLDLAVMKQIDALPTEQASSQWFRLWQSLTELLETMLRFPKPIIAAVDGVADGAGLALCLACDLVVAGDEARFAASAARRGLVGATTAVLLKHRLGHASAAELTMSPTEWDATEAAARGLVSRVVSSDQVWVAAQTLGETVGAGDAAAIAGTKRVLNETVGEALLSQMTAAACDGATFCATESAREGLAAFVEKRDPKFP